MKTKRKHISPAITGNELITVNNQTVPMDTVSLVRYKMDMTAQTIDAMLLGPIVASMGPIMQALGMQEISTQAILMKINDINMKSLVSCVVLILSLAQDDQVEASEFGNHLINPANNLTKP